MAVSKSPAAGRREGFLPGFDAHTYGGLWHEVAPELVVPEVFTYTEEPLGPGEPSATLQMRVTEGKVVCEALEVKPVPGAPIATTSLRRVPLAGMIQRAPLVAAVRIVFDEADPARDPVTIRVRRSSGSEADAWIAIDGPRPANDPAPMFVAPLSEGDKRHLRDAAQPSRRAPIQLDDNHLEQVRDTYRNAMALRQRPVKAIMERWSVSRSLASNWVRDAREAGLLGPARERHAGEF